MLRSIFVHPQLSFIALSLALCVGCAPTGLLRDKSDTALGKEAESSAKPAKKKSADEPGTYIQQLAKARSFEASSQFEEARTIYAKLIAEQPNRFEAYHRLAVVADKRRRHQEAQELYVKALKLNPNNAEIQNDLSYSYFLGGQLPQAEAAAKKAIALAPKNTKYLNNLGLIHGHQGRFDTALADFRKGGSEADAQYNMAFVLAAKNDMEGAKDCFHKALAANPQFELARRALKNFERADNDPAMLADYEETNDRGVRLIPYVEPDDNSAAPSKVQPAVAMSTATRSNTRALQTQARSMMQERLTTDK